MASAHNAAEFPGSGGQADDSEKLLRIRDLLFGDAARDQAQRTEFVESSLQSALADAEARFQSELDSAVAAAMSSANSALADLTERFEKKIRSMQAEVSTAREELRVAQAALKSQVRGKVERSDFAAMLSELAKRVGDGDPEEGALKGGATEGEATEEEATEEGDPKDAS